MRSQHKSPTSEVPKYRLLASPEPFFDESPASWVQRICFAHQYSLARLLSILKMSNSARDFDLKMSSEERHLLFALTETGSKACGRAIEAYAVAAMIDGSHWLSDRHGSPKYRFCPECLGSDIVPYLRWWWRFTKATRCLYHGCEMLEQCTWCGAPLVLSRAVLSSSGPKVAIETLGHCQECGLPRYDTLSNNSEFAPPRISPEPTRKGRVRLLLYEREGLQLSLHFEDKVVHTVEMPHATRIYGERRALMPTPGRLAYALRLYRDEINTLGVLPVGYFMRQIQEELNREAGRDV